MPRNQGRFVGIVYLLVSIPAIFALIYVPSKIIVRADPAATAANIAAHETLFRLGIGAEILSQTAFVGVAFLLYELLKHVNRRQALYMFWLIALPLPLILLNELNALAALALVHAPASQNFGFLGPNLFATLAQPQRESLAMFFLYLHNRGFDLASIFWGLWLFPLGLLVYQSDIFPRIPRRILGALLIANCCAYVLDAFTTLVTPQYDDLISRLLSPLRFGELIFMFWLVIMGTKTREKETPRA
jgi:hypothetical protein